MANADGVGKGQEEIASEKRQEAFRLRCTGMGYRDIAKHLGVSPATAHNYIKSVLEENHKQTLELGRKYVELELKRLDEMYEAISQKARGGDLAAQDMALKILARRTKYLGLDMPDETKVSGEISLKDLLLKSMNPDKET